MTRLANGYASSKLLVETLRLLKERDPEVTLIAISKATGLTARWLSHFNTENSSGPAVDKVECLWRYLTGRELPL